MRDQRERRRAGRRLPRCIGSSASGVGSLALTLVVCRFQLRLRARRECRSAAARGDSAYFMRSSAVICRTTSDPVSTWRSKSRCRSCLRCSSRSFGVATGSPSLSLSPNDTPRLSFYPRLMSMGPQPSRTARRTHGHSLRKSVRRKRAPPSLCGFSDSCTMHTSIPVWRAPPGSALDEWLVAHDRRLFARGCAGRSAAR
jgi:hypothetical protein